MSENIINVAFAGNPNCGKTTLFNAFTGARLKVANWPGVTVEKKEGSFKFQNEEFKLVDLPGIYSLTSFTMEEKLSREYILSDEVDVIVDVLDASSFERNLYLTLQLIELGKPVVIALNMMDIVEERGMELDIHRMQEMLGVPVIPVSARKKTGLDTLMHAVSHHKDKTVELLIHDHAEGKHKHNHHEEYALVYSDEVEDKIDMLEERLAVGTDKSKEALRWQAIKYLENDSQVMEKYPIDTKSIIDKNCEYKMINEKYDFIEEITEEVMLNKSDVWIKTSKADKVLTHRIWAIPIFLLIMAVIFFLTFTVGDFFKGFLEDGLAIFSDAAVNKMTAWGVNEIVISLISGGIISGVGGILTFIPNIIILFIALAFLEDSGYMSRVAYVMDGIMSKLGLSGRAFLPMLIGFGCTVPAIMASRALERKGDRLKTIFITPFMSCSARLPVYILISELFFGKYAMLAAYSMYVLGVVIAILSAFVLSKISKTKENNTLLIELPEYKMPNFRTVYIYVFEKVKDYITKAGTTILIASVILWFLQNFNFNGICDISQSFAAMIGKFISPIFTLNGLSDWRIIVALISGIAAKEVVVSSMSVLFGLGNIFTDVGKAALQTSLLNAGFGPVNAYSMMIFVLLYIPCIATIATIKKETNSDKWTIGAVCAQLGIAYLVSTIFYQVAILFI